MFFVIRIDAHGIPGQVDKFEKLETAISYAKELANRAGIPENEIEEYIDPDCAMPGMYFNEDECSGVWVIGLG